MFLAVGKIIEAVAKPCGISC